MATAKKELLVSMGLSVEDIGMIRSALAIQKNGLQGEIAKVKKDKRLCLKTRQDEIASREEHIRDIAKMRDRLVKKEDWLILEQIKKGQ